MSESSPPTAAASTPQQPVKEPVEQPVELLRALATCAEPPTPELTALADLLDLGEPPSAADYTETFLLDLYPYASVYLGEEGMMGGAARDRIAGFFRALSLTPPAEPDHLAVLLGAWARLLELERQGDDGRFRHARNALLWEHLLPWLPLFLRHLESTAPPFYRGWARLLKETLKAAAGAERAPELLSLHLRSAPPLADPRQTGADSFLAALLSPVTSGILLTRGDLAVAARQTGLAMRLGGRRFVLSALLSQESDGALAWLGDEARRWATAHRSEGLWASPELADFWAHRAQGTVAKIAELRAS